MRAIGQLPRGPAGLAAARRLAGHLVARVRAGLARLIHGRGGGASALPGIGAAELAWLVAAERRAAGRPLSRAAAVARIRARLLAAGAAPPRPAPGG